MLMRQHANHVELKTGQRCARRYAKHYTKRYTKRSSPVRGLILYLACLFCNKITPQGPHNCSEPSVLKGAACDDNVLRPVQ